MTPPVTIGLLNPGEMGAAVARCLTGQGHTVLWASAGRSDDTAQRAAQAGLTDARTPRELARQAEVILSVCPPHAALDVAWSVHGYTGLYVDANAVAPDTAREVAKLITGNGGRYVDGGIVGSPPAGAGGTTRLFLSGDDEAGVAQVAGLFAGTALEARVVTGPATGASAVKMAYAAVTKASSALLLTALSLARAEGVEAELLAEWARSQPQLSARLAGAARSSATKGWRWVGEMEEIAHAIASAGLPDGFHQAAAEVFRRSPRLPGELDDEQVTAAVLAAIAGMPQ